MQKQLEDLQPKLVVAAEETNRTMKVIERESAAAEKTSAKVAADEAAANIKAADAKALKDECEMELAEAMPALEAALAALDTLKVRDRAQWDLLLCGRVVGMGGRVGMDITLCSLGERHGGKHPEGQRQGPVGSSVVWSGWEVGSGWI